jgi:hypothetical protein
VSSTFEHGVVHPVLACIEAMESALKATADVQVMFLAPADKRAALVELTRVAALVTHYTRTDPA